MIISTERSRLIGAILDRLYSAPFTPQTLLSIAPEIARAANSHYFSVLLFPNRFVPRHKLWTTNRPAYVRTYMPLIPMDFLIEHLVATGAPTVLSHFGTEVYLRNRDFCVPALEGRPISDLCYVPLRIERFLAGYVAISRAGTNRRIRRCFGLRRRTPYNMPYTENDLSLLRFLAAFVAERFADSVLSCPGEDDVAYLDSSGKLVGCGARIDDAITYLRRDPLRRWQMDTWQDRFLFRHHKPGCSGLAVHAGGRTFRFSISYVEPREFRTCVPDCPVARVELHPDEPGERSLDPLPCEWLQTRHSLSAREAQVARLVYRGRTNSQIGAELGITESTVKRHVHSILEKTRTRSRAQMILQLANADG